MSNCPWREIAPLYALGSLSHEERESFSEHLLSGCASCGGELEAARASIAALDLHAAQEALSGGELPGPSDELRDRLFEQLEPKPETPQVVSAFLESPENPGVRFLLASDEFEPTAVEGVEVRRLQLDEEQGTATSLYRMQPGSSYPPHVHGGREECYVLSGDLQSGEQRMRAGDYQVAEKGSVHGVQSTEGGCLLFIVESLKDRPISA